MIKSIYKKIISIGLSLIILITNIIPNFAMTAKDVYNGSPLLSKNSSTTEVSIKEHVGLAFYMSSLCYCGIDSYMSVIDENSKFGSKGIRKSSLNFLSESTIDSLMPYLQQVASIQASSAPRGPIVDGNGTPITLEQFISKPFVPGTDNKNTTYYVEDKMVFSAFHSGVILRALIYATEKYNKSALEKVKSACNDRNLYLDCMGNIVLNKDDTTSVGIGNIVIYPAAYNPLLFRGVTNTQTYKDITEKSPVFLNVAGTSFYDLVDKTLEIYSVDKQKQINLNSSDITIQYKKEKSFWGAVGIGAAVAGGAVLLATGLGAPVGAALIGGAKLAIGAGAILALKTDMDSFDKISGIPAFCMLDTVPNINDGSYLDMHLLTCNSDGKYRFKVKDTSGTSGGDSRATNQQFLLNFLLLCQSLTSTNEGSSDSVPYQKIIIDYHNANTKYKVVLDENLLETSKLRAINTESLITLLSPEEKKEQLVNDSLSFFAAPGLWLLNVVGQLFSGIAVNIYNATSDYSKEQRGERINTLGYTNIFSYPIISNIIDVTTNNIEFILGILLIICLFLGLKRNPIKMIGIFVLASLIIIYYPKVFNKITLTYNNILTSMFSSNQSSWILNHNILWNRATKQGSDEDLMMQTDADYYSTSTLAYVQDKSPIITNVPSEEIQKSLNSMGLGYLFLGAILKQYVYNDEVSSSMLDYNKRLIMLNYLFSPENNDVTELVHNMYYSKFMNKSLRVSHTVGLSKMDRDSYFKFDEFQTSDTASPANKDTIESYIPKYPTVDPDSGQEIELSVELENTYVDKTHQDFYVLKGINLYNLDKFDYNSNYTTNDFSNLYATYFANKDVPQDSVSPISHFNYYNESKYDQNYGYFILTENVLPYFYTVFNDMFIGKTKVDIGYLIEGYVEKNNGQLELTEVNVGGKTEKLSKRNSIFVKDSKIIDYLDLHNLFKNVIPYCYQVSNAAHNSMKEKIEDDYLIYQDNNKSWLFEANWAVKFFDEYHEDMKNATVFSEAQGNPNSQFEEQIQEFYYKLTPELENLIVYINQDGVDAGVCIRYMATMAGLYFNRIFSTGKAKLSPTNIDPGSIGVNSLFNQLLMTNGTVVDIRKSAAENMQGSYSFFDLLLVSICSITIAWILPVFRIIILVCFCILIYVSVIINVAFEDKSSVSEGVTLLNWVIGLLSGFIQLVVFFGLPQLILLWFCTSSLMKNIHLPITIYFLILAISGYFGVVLSIQVFKNFIPWDKNGFNFEKLRTLGGNTVTSAVGNAINKVGGVVKSAGFGLTLGSGLFLGSLAAKGIKTGASKAINFTGEKARQGLAGTGLLGSEARANEFERREKVARVRAKNLELKKEKYYNKANKELQKVYKGDDPKAEKRVEKLLKKGNSLTQKINEQKAKADHYKYK